MHSSLARGEIFCNHELANSLSILLSDTQVPGRNSAFPGSSATKTPSSRKTAFTAILPVPDFRLLPTPGERSAIGWPFTIRFLITWRDASERILAHTPFPESRGPGSEQKSRFQVKNCQPAPQPATATCSLTGSRTGALAASCRSAGHYRTPNRRACRNSGGACKSPNCQQIPVPDLDKEEIDKSYSFRTETCAELAIWRSAVRV